MSNQSFLFTISSSYCFHCQTSEQLFLHTDFIVEQDKASNQSFILTVLIVKLNQTRKDESLIIFFLFSCQTESNKIRCEPSIISSYCPYCQTRYGEQSIIYSYCPNCQTR
ncbi:hypothetical protein BCR32DRAFT_279524 [Anaeromyces robustus]|uniref:Uncharacterized protein n=1 Tax=Anaeromyces robustus TaxID=1754192 RepID=A0A1Y1X7C7_9FUNG|nr:hypothetical protein BCR32DRAFT_279524 [Anaeromyces robustus]|eukprot:ORX81680.1 hypothetical protein BCR32DRAFT_279524 [Anaeromyces robustus]